jgi:hypothetical protein
MWKLPRQIGPHFSTISLNKSYAAAQQATVILQMTRQ